MLVYNNNNNRYIYKLKLSTIFFFFAEPNLCKGGKGSLEQKPSTSDDNLAET